MIIKMNAKRTTVNGHDADLSKGKGSDRQAVSAMLKAAIAKKG